MLLFVATMTQAQDDPYKAFRKANSARVKYNTNPEGNVEALQEAKDKIDYATKEENIGKIPAKKLANVWLGKGDIYLALAKSPIYIMKNPEAAAVAVEAYKKVFGVELAKKSHTRNAGKGLKNAATELWVRGAGQIDAKDYKGAFTSYKGMLDARDFILEIDKALDPLAGEDEQGQSKYLNFVENAALLAVVAEDKKAADKYYNILLKEGVEKASIYDGLFKANMESDLEKALGYLQTGREKYPEDQTLLYSEINYFLKEGKMAELEGRLKKAIEQDPDNKSLYYVLGNTYYNLMQTASDEIKKIYKDGKGKEQAETLTARKATVDEMYPQALKYYDEALSKDEKYFEVLYMAGALRFNMGVQIAAERDALDFSDQKNYDRLNGEFKKYLSQAFPYFVKAEQLKANDLSTIIALKECYAQANKLEHSKAFKERMQKLQADAKAALEPYASHPEKIFD